MISGFSNIKIMFCYSVQHKDVIFLYIKRYES